MKRIRLSALLAVFPLLLSAQATIWVAPDGHDAADGTREHPKATVHGALRQAREWRRLTNLGLDQARFSVNGPLTTLPDISKGITIRVAEGVYYLDEPILLRPEDSGTAGSRTVVCGQGEGTVLSGGLRLEAKAWKKAGKTPGLSAKVQGQVWVCPQPKRGGRYVEFRQLWVNGQKALRARSVNDENFPRILAWDKKEGVLTVPAEAIGSLRSLDGVEMCLHQMWAVSFLRVKEVAVSEGRADLRFHQPESRIQAEHPWPSPMTKEGVESPFYLCNAPEYLDSPGEWYLDTDKHLLYYWPRKGENLAKSEAVVPCLETLVAVEGSKESPVQHIGFEHIAFQHTTWMRPSQQGHVPLQAGMYLLDAYKLRPNGVPGNPNKGLENQAWVGRPAAAVSLCGSQQTFFRGCAFRHLASCGLDFVDTNLNDTVAGCRFEDIGGNGLQAGRFSDLALEGHLPYEPTDLRELTEGLYIGDSRFTDCTNEDWGCCGIAAGFVRRVTIEHNELSELSYTGISLGWGWQKALNTMRENTVKGNYIHHYAKHMYDVAGIYTLSAQPKTLICENVVDSIYSPAYVHDPHHWFYLYTDEGSSFLTVRDNWCPAEKFLQNANGPGNLWENNGPMVSDRIRRTAGPRY